MLRKLLLTSLCLFSSVAYTAEIVVQTDDPNTSSTGVWRIASGATLPYDGNRGRYKVLSEGVGTYTFTPNLPETTMYTVEVYNTCYSPRSSQVTHQIVYSGGYVEYVIDQDCQTDPYAGQWRILGSYPFDVGSSGSVTIDTTNSNNVYVGATAVRFVYIETGAPVNQAPTIVPNVYNITVTEGDTISVNATALDLEDGDISTSIVWSALGDSSTGANFSILSGQSDFNISLAVTDSGGVSAISSITVTVIPLVVPTSTVYDFECINLETLPANFVVNNPSSLPNVGMQCGRYTARLLDNLNDITLHFNDLQGRFDGVLVSFPFKVIARNIGISPVDNPTNNYVYAGSAYLFSGLQVHHTNFSRIDSVHLVVGQRGSKQNTIEGKTTVSSSSTVSDIGADQLLNGRADIMLEGTIGGQIIAYWQQPNISGDPLNDNWVLYNGTGDLPGGIPNWGSLQVYVGLITYAQGVAGVPFMGVADSFEVIQN